MAGFSGQSIFINAISGLSNTYAMLANTTQNPNLSLKDLTNSDNLKNLSLNPSFLSYLTSNFGSIDSDNDGTINQNDINKLCQNMQTKGLTQNEIVQFCSQSGNSSLLDTVMNYFTEIDKNKDGRVTMEEINSFNIASDRERLTEEYSSFDGNKFSVFYGSEDGNAYTKGSVLSSRYPSNNNKQS